MNSIQVKAQTASQITAVDDWFEISDPALLPKNPIVSVLMLAYMHEHYILQAIEGVIAQNINFSIELVIAEDDSPDKTRILVTEYQKKYPEIIRCIFSIKNVGMIKNYRNALDNCRGEFVAICEGDDYWIDQLKLVKQLAALRKWKCIDICAHPCYNLSTFSRSRLTPACVYSIGIKIFSLQEVVLGDGGFVPTASIFVRKAVLDSFPNYLYGILPVLDYYIQIMGARRGGLLFMPEVMSVYRLMVNGSWSESMREINKRLAFEQAFFLSTYKIKKEIDDKDDAIEEVLAIRAINGWVKERKTNDKTLAEFYLDQIKNNKTKKIILKFWLSFTQFYVGGLIWIIFNLIKGLLDRVSQRLRVLIFYFLDKR